MPIMEKLKMIFQLPFWRHQWTLLSLWILMIVISVGLHMHNFNNFLIYKFTFWHALDGKSIFENHGDHFDVNHYGPIFSLIIAPFTIISKTITSMDNPLLWVDVFLWHLALGMFLWWAIRKTPLTAMQKVVVIWLTAHEMLNALGMSQFNVATAAMILLTYAAIHQGKEIWAAFWIVLGTLVKIYGIVGLAFFFFVKNKPKFILWLVVWTLVLMALPMPFFGAEYVAGQYVEWFKCLSEKGQENLLSDFQNISLLGMVRKIGYACSAGLAGYYEVFESAGKNPDVTNWWWSTWNDLWLIIPAIIYSALPWLRFKQYQHHAFQLMCLALMLMFVNIFSTGAENSSYIISMLGVAIWFIAVPWKRSRLDWCLLIFCFILTSLSSTDLFPGDIRTYWIRAFSLKAMPVVLIWLKLVWEMCTRDYRDLPQSAPLVTSK
jgi:hypothetical protein